MKSTDEKLCGKRKSVRTQEGNQLGLGEFENWKTKQNLKNVMGIFGKPHTHKTIMEIA